MCVHEYKVNQNGHVVFALTSFGCCLKNATCHLDAHTVNLYVYMHNNGSLVKIECFSYMYAVVI